MNIIRANILLSLNIIYQIVLEFLFKSTTNSRASGSKSYNKRSQEIKQKVHSYKNFQRIFVPLQLNCPLTRYELVLSKTFYAATSLIPLSDFFDSYLKPGLHIVVTIAELASDVAPKRILRLSIHGLQIFLVKYEYLRSLQLCEDQGIRGKLN